MKRRIGPLPTASEEVLNRVRLGFFERGETIAAWSREHGFEPDAVYQVISGRTLAVRGNAHRIAVALGIKSTATKTPELMQPLAGKEDPM